MRVYICDITRPDVRFEFSIFLQYKISHFGFNRNHYFRFGFIRRFESERNAISIFSLFLGVSFAQYL